MAKLLRVLIPSAALAAMALGAGFYVFTNSIGSYVPGSVSRADAIVVLTGGEDRVATGIQLIAAGRGQRLLISGVHPSGSATDLRRRHGGNDRLFQCCIDLGHDATDTVGNAEEARAWVEGHGYRSLIVVTSSYHMPRSMTEFARVMPDVTLKPYPVPSRTLKLQAWWQHQPTARLLIGEYFKFLTATARFGVSRMLSLDVRRSVASQAAEPGRTY